MKIPVTKKRALNPVQILSIGFAAVILTGGLILSLPISSQSGEFTNFLDSVFTATSAVCVTGLVTIDTGSHWNYFGKTIIAILIELGGLGFMSVTTLVALVIGKKITLKERLVMQEAYNAQNLQGIIRLVRYILIFTLGVQLTAALVLMTQFIPEFGIGKGIYYGIWHSISAFCNAGFDLFGNEVTGKFQSLTLRNTNKIVLLTLGNLIVIGGLGFSVWLELWNNRKKPKMLKRLSLHSKVVLLMTAILIFGGALIFLLLEWNYTLTGMNFVDKLINAWFASITPRTAGFNSVNTTDMAPASRFITMLLMFIGGSPGSTAGGIKTTTFGIVIFTIFCVLKGREDTELFGKRLSKGTVYKAVAVFSIGLSLVLFDVIILSITESGTSLELIMYEVFSAFGTVGLTLGITPGLTSVGKVVILTTMYLGRVGPMTVMLALANIKAPAAIKYPEDHLLIG
jgi:trk system potassium uptake protein TrkH